jgi:hypothetical protein
MVNFTSVDIPWAGIDSELFLAEHIEQKKIPATFPAVSEKILKEMEEQKRKQMELMCPVNMIKAPGRKKKKKMRQPKKKKPFTKYSDNESEKEGPKAQSFRLNYDNISAVSDVPSRDLRIKGSIEGASQRGGYRSNRQRGRQQSRRQPLSYRDLDYGGFD